VGVHHGFTTAPPDITAARPRQALPLALPRGNLGVPRASSPTPHEAISASPLQSPSPAASSPSPVMERQINLLPRGVDTSPPPPPARDASSSSRSAIPVVNRLGATPCPVLGATPRPCPSLPPPLVSRSSTPSPLSPSPTSTRPFRDCDGHMRHFRSRLTGRHGSITFGLEGYYSTVVRGPVHGGHQIQERISDHLRPWSCRAAPHSSGSASRTSTPSTR
jgi:hypothetical protein